MNGSTMRKNIGLTMRKNPDDDKLPHKTMKETWGFLQKLQGRPGEVIDQIHPVKNAADDRARVALVDQKKHFGAIFFELDDEGSRHFVYAGTYGNPEVYDRAASMSFKVNPINGVVSLIDLGKQPPAPARDSAPAAATPAAPAPAASAPAARPAPAKPRDTAAAPPRDSAPETDSVPAADPARTAPGESKRPPRPSAGVPAHTVKPRGLLADHDVDEVEMMLGVDRAAFNAVNALTTEDGLDDALTFSPGWERDALLGLVAGMTVEEVLADLMLGDEAAVDVDKRMEERAAERASEDAAAPAETETAVEDTAADDVAADDAVTEAPESGDPVDAAADTSDENNFDKLFGDSGESEQESEPESAQEPAYVPKHASESTDRPTAVAPTASDAEIMDGIRKPAASAEFTYIGEDADALQHIIEGGSFNAWRVFLHPSQRDMVDKDFNGSARVTGGAGTGKTVVVVHRAHRLATLGDRGARVLLTTFTRGLADSLKSQMNVLDPHHPEAGDVGEPGLWISGIDAFAFKVMSNATKQERAAAITKVTGQEVPDPTRLGSPSALGAKTENSMWRDALNIVENPPTGYAATLDFLHREYIGVILAQGITSLADYRKAPRPGSGVRLNRSDRAKVWSVIEQFHRLCRDEGKFAWPAQAAIASEILNAKAEEGHQRPFDHVLVDEAQDFHAGHWRLLRAAVEEGPDDIFLAEDSHQRIYGQRLTLSRFGIKTVGRSRRLTVNYRTTRENLGYASAMLDGVEWIDSEGLSDELTGYRSMRSGPHPIVAQCTNPAEEETAIAEAIEGWLEEGDGVNIGVLARTRAAVKRMVSALTEAGIKAVETRNATKAAEVQVSVMTMHGAKGLEFTHVVLAGVNADAMPAQYRLDNLTDEDRADELQQERALLYVAASRARDQLMVTYSGDKSEFLPELELA